jgi:hypothetical protein
VEYPGAIYHVMDRGDRREDILIIGTAKGVKSVLHRSGPGQYQHKPARAGESWARLEFQSTVTPFQPSASDPGVDEHRQKLGKNCLLMPCATSGRMGP